MTQYEFLIEKINESSHKHGYFSVFYALKAIEYNREIDHEMIADAVFHGWSWGVLNNPHETRGNKQKALLFYDSLLEIDKAKHRAVARWILEATRKEQTYEYFRK